MGRKSTTKTKSSSKAGPVAAVRHKDKRINIPTEELRDFVRADEHAPRAMLYPRDPSLDPQLVWKGKDEQDRVDFEVPVVPIYIQEKVHPQAIIEDFRRHAAARKTEQSGETPSLYGDFNGLPEAFEDRVDFYSQKDDNQVHWSNRLILGDSLLVMTSLAEKEGLKGKVQTIYIDPPYGIKFGSNWQVSTRKRDVKDGKAEDATRQPEQVRAFRDTWQLGIHSYLSYLRDRLTLARELLTETGSVFVQIGDENVHRVRCLLDEIFGDENLCAFITFKKTTGTGSFAGRTNELSATNDYILWYAKAKGVVKYRELYQERAMDGIGGTAYGWIESPEGNRRRMLPTERASMAEIVGRVFRGDNLTSQTVREAATTVFPVEFDGRRYLPSAGRGWATNREGMKRLTAANRVIGLGNTLSFVRYWDDFPLFPFSNMWTDTTIAGFADPKVYVVQTNVKVVERCLLMSTDPGDLVFDPTCGSGTTAYVAEQWGRRWITCDTSRVALGLARTRLMAAKFPYYYLADEYPQAVQFKSKEEVKKYLRHTAPRALTPAALSRGEREEGPDIRKGFVHERVPHVTLKSIANNPDFKEGMSREEIDASIARHAESETLYDKPYEDAKRVRVTGPFTVESLSPHRTISVDEKKNLAEKPSDLGFTIKMLVGGDFANMILDNLRTAGVQNMVKGQRLKFDRLEVHPGMWINGAGEFTDADGKVKHVAVCIGPEHGTVGPQLVKEAAKEAVKGKGFDVLIVCGFAFDPHVGEEAKRYGDLVVLPANMNPDLTMGESLKKTASANLFMVFGEPDIDIRKQDGQVVVEIRGLDVYDPTTGEIRSGIATDEKTGKTLHDSRDDVACWFIDTNYNGESFFVRHAYFTGADEPYDKLKRALRAEIDESAWSALYTTVSRPFATPKTGKIAVKVINHYGDEVLRVYEID